MKSILLHIYDDTALESRLEAAFDLARAFGSHITCLHATPFEDYLAADPLVAAALPLEFSRKMRRRRLELQARVEANLTSANIEWDWVHLDEIMSAALITHSLMSDIIVLSLADAAISRDDPRPLAASVAIGAQVPVLAVPEKSRGIVLTAPAVVAWNGSPEAAAALRSSLPLLRLASSVTLLEVEERGASAALPNLAHTYLARHGIESAILRRPATQGASAAISAAAAELGAGMIVMGAFGHSRLRQFLLGGVTRDLLVDSEVPLLLAH